MWAEVQDGLRDQGMEAEPVHVVDESGRPTKGCLDLLTLVAKHGMTLATGHLAADEIVAVVDAALDAGVRRVVVTHPEFTSQRLSVDVQQRLAAKGALLERCFTTPHTGKVSWEEMLHNIRAVGPEHSVLSSDLGQPFNPPVEDGLPLMVDTLLGNRFSEDEVVRMAHANTLAVAGVESAVAAR